jgi:hypothetical protein
VTALCLRLQAKPTQLGTIDKKKNRTMFYFYLKYNVLETGFCLRLQVKPTQLGTIDKKSDVLFLFKIQRFGD